MADDAFTKPEVPDAFRDLMKISIEQTKRAFETFAATSEKAWKTFETSSQTAGSGLRSLNEKIAEITRNNAEANFALAMKLAESKDVGQAMELQTEHARKQMESFVHQLEEIRDLAAQVRSRTARLRACPAASPEPRRLFLEARREAPAERTRCLLRQLGRRRADDHHFIVLVIGVAQADLPFGVVHDKDCIHRRDVAVAGISRTSWCHGIARRFG